MPSSLYSIEIIPDNCTDILGLKNQRFVVMIVLMVVLLLLLKTERSFLQNWAKYSTAQSTKDYVLNLPSHKNPNIKRNPDDYDVIHTSIGYIDSWIKCKA